MHLVVQKSSALSQELLATIIPKNPNPLLVNAQGLTPLDLALKLNNTSIIESLKAYIQEFSVKIHSSDLLTFFRQKMLGMPRIYLI